MTLGASLIKRIKKERFQPNNERNSVLVQSNLENFLYMLESSTSTGFSDKWIQMPRKPKWNESLSSEEYKKLEYQNFLMWRKRLSEVEESDYGILTPFERNLEIWKQLWQVVERCSVIIQILDARNPLLYFSVDLFKYAQEVDPNKQLLLLLNKSDYLTPRQLKFWAHYFNSKKYNFIFYSALEENENLEDDNIPEIQEKDVFMNQEEIVSSQTFKKILSKFFDSHKIGFVGYPNVGKSSTINSLLKKRISSVSATPGKTKHLQSHYLNDTIIIYDCPGLVFPNLAHSKAELIINGILSIDHLRDWKEPIALLVSRISAENLCKTYGIKSNMMGTEKFGLDFLELLARKKGFFTSNFGNPDVSRVTRFVLKDYVSGKLLYCHPPPEVSLDDYVGEINTPLERGHDLDLESYYERLKF